MSIGRTIAGMGAAFWAFVFIFCGRPGAGLLLCVIAVYLVLRGQTV